uniref:Uncharacterized protein n=1 Tax=Timema douglasi TaxID=61478 RepID=A0A7R8ZBD6_TIMDO|nr:unnamed protein product [Timema douglasi]
MYNGSGRITLCHCHFTVSRTFPPDSVKQWRYEHYVSGSRSGVGTQSIMVEGPNTVYLLVGLVIMYRIPLVSHVIPLGGAQDTLGRPCDTLWWGTGYPLVCNRIPLVSHVIPLGGEQDTGDPMAKLALRGMSEPTDGSERSFIAGGKFPFPCPVSTWRYRCGWSSARTLPWYACVTGHACNIPLVHITVGWKGAASLTGDPSDPHRERRSQFRLQCACAHSWSRQDCLLFVSRSRAAAVLKQCWDRTDRVRVLGCNAGPMYLNPLRWPHGLRQCFSNCEVHITGEARGDLVCVKDPIRKAGRMQAPTIRLEERMSPYTYPTDPSSSLSNQFFTRHCNGHDSGRSSRSPLKLNKKESGQNGQKSGC